MILNTVATTSITGGTGITSGKNELVINDTAGLTITSPIVQNSGSDVVLTKVGSGTLVLTNAATYRLSGIEQ